MNAPLTDLTMESSDLPSSLDPGLHRDDVVQENRVFLE